MKPNFTKEDFYELLTPNGDCLEWSMAKTKSGYGVKRIDGKNVYTHRLALELEGVDVSNKHVLHSCDNPSCCNPSHLRVGSNMDNVLDRMKRNRQLKGSKIGNSKLTESIVIELRNRARMGETHSSLAKEFGIARSVVTRAVNKTTWKHV